MNNSGLIKEKINQILEIPVLGAVIVTVLAFLIYGVIFPIIAIKVGKIFGFDNLTFCTLMEIVGAILILCFYEWWYKDEYKGSFAKFTIDKRLIIGCILFFLVDNFSVIFGFITKEASLPSVLLTITALMAGICEEITFRVLPISITMKHTDSKYCIALSVIVSSILFGFAHPITELIGSGTGNLSGIMVKALVTGASGAVYAAIYLRTGNILIPMVLHALGDYLKFIFVSDPSTGVSTTGASAATYAVNLIMVTINILIFAIIMKGHRDDIKKVWTGCWNKGENKTKQ